MPGVTEEDSSSNGVITAPTAPRNQSTNVFEANKAEIIKCASSWPKSPVPETAPEFLDEDEGDLPEPDLPEPAVQSPMRKKPILFQRNPSIVLDEDEDHGISFRCMSNDDDTPPIFSSTESNTNGSSLSPMTSQEESVDDQTENKFSATEVNEVKPVSRTRSGVRFYSEGAVTSETTSKKGKVKFQRSIVEKWKRVVERAMSMEDPWALNGIENFPEEECTRHRYSSIRQKWVTDTVRVKMEQESFARGAMRMCYRLKKLSNFNRSSHWSNALNYVAKSYIDPETPRETYFEDVKLQMDAKLWAEEYNRHNPPKKVDIFQITILEFKDRIDKPLYHLEHFIEGEYIKYNSNSGFVDEGMRNTPHAFSHFTFERSGHQLIVVDVQGVGDLYTDPQIHTREGTGYGDGNLGTKGMALFFSTHYCNEICKNMDLTPFDLAPTERNIVRKSVKRLPSDTVCNKNRVESCLTPGKRDTDNIMEFLRQRTMSQCSDKSGPTTSVHSLEEVEEEGDEIAETTWPMDQTESEDNQETPKRRAGPPRTSCDEVFAIPLRRSRMDSYLESDSSPHSSTSGLTQMSEREAYWEQMRKMSRPAGLDNFDVEELRKLRKASEKDEAHSAGSILGQVHLDLCRYHELGRFIEDGEPANEYDKRAAWFHLELAANCGVLEAILTAARIFLGLPHDLLADFDVEQDENNIDQGLDWMQTAAEMGDKGAILFLADAYERGEPLGSERKQSFGQAVHWLEESLHTHPDIDEDSAVALCTVDTPRYQIHAKMAELYRSGGIGLEKNPMKAGDLFTEAAEEAMESAKGKLATKYYMLADEAWAEVEEE